MRLPIEPNQVPILLIAWRRPNTLKRVIDALRPLAPSNLFVACDAARVDHPCEAANVVATRELIAQAIDWPCRVQQLYSERNLGCSSGPIAAINWFFSQVEEGIILEDDCVPHPDFFFYCTALLERYRSDTRIWCISGTNYQAGIWRGDASYYFSRYNHCWGWASWRRCWQHYDSRISSWPAMRDGSYLDFVFEDPLERRYWASIWERTYSSSTSITWWDYQWSYACMINGGLTALPNVNLISNVGFGPDSSHFPLDREPAKIDRPLGVLTHPSFILRDIKADSYTFENHFLDSSRRFRGITLPRLKAKLLNRLSSMRRHSFE